MKTNIIDIESQLKDINNKKSEIIENYCNIIREEVSDKFAFRPIKAKNGHVYIYTLSMGTDYFDKEEIISEYRNKNFILCGIIVDVVENTIEKTWLRLSDTEYSWEYVTMDDFRKKFDTVSDNINLKIKKLNQLINTQIKND